MKNYIGFRADRTLGRKNGGVITCIKATEAVDAAQLIEISNFMLNTNSYRCMQKRNIVIINVSRPQTALYKKSSAPLSELRTKLI